MRVENPSVPITPQSTPRGKNDQIDDGHAKGTTAASALRGLYGEHGNLATVLEATEGATERTHSGADKNLF